MEAANAFAHIVEQALAGREDDLKEYSIALSVYDRGKDFNPAADRFVSTAAGALRKKLDKYYCDEVSAFPLGVATK